MGTGSFTCAMARSWNQQLTEDGCWFLASSTLTARKANHCVMGIYVSSPGNGQVVSNPCLLSNCWHDRCRVLCPTVFENIKRRLSRLPEAKGDARPSQKGYLVTPTPSPNRPENKFSALRFPACPLSQAHLRSSCGQGCPV